MTVFNLDPEVKQERIHVTTGGRRMCMLERNNSSAWIRDDQGRKTEFTQILSASESVLSELREPARFPLLSMLRWELLAWRFYHRFRTDELSPIRRPQPGVRTPVLSADGSDLAAALQTILEIGDRDMLKKAVADAFPGSALEIASTGLGFAMGLRMPEFMDPLWQQELSDGMLQYLCLVAALLSPRPASLIVLNEPETSLHVEMLPALASLIAHASRSSQLLVTTHSSQLCELTEKHVRVNTLRLQKIKGETRIVSNESE